MTTTFKPSYGTSTAISLNSAFNTLANAAARGIAAVDNSSGLAADVQLTILATLASGSPTGSINVWFAGSEDGTNYTDNYGGTDAVVTLRSPNNLRGPFSVQTPTSGALTYNIVIPGILRFFGGMSLPRKWGFVIDNESGLAFTACSASYTPINFTNG